jgi:lysophospholipase L1-like esterase
MRRVVVVLAVCLGAASALAGHAFAAPARPSLEYIALGDSYTAGPGILLPIGFPPGCRRSDHNYPSLVRAALRARTFRDVSCSGATLADMTTPQATDGGTNPPQLDALSAATNLVTLGIGGNDIGFTDVLTTCLQMSSLNARGAPCRDYYTRTGQDELNQRIEIARPKVAQTLAAIRMRSPNALVLVVGYPTVVPNSGPGCRYELPFSTGDVAYLRDTEQRLNAMLAQEAQQAGARFVDTYRSSIGHDVCRMHLVKWVEGFIPLSPAAPLHPNGLGMHNSADQVLAALRAAP